MRHLTFFQLMCAFALLAGILAAYGFWYTVVGKASAESAELAGQIRELSQESARVASAKEALVSLAADESAVNQYFVRQEDVVPFLEGVENTGKALGATVEVVSVAAETANGRNRIKLSLKISGSFDSVLRTLGALEYGPYDSSITNLAFDTVPTDSEGAPVRWTAAASFVIGAQATTTVAISSL